MEREILFRAKHLKADYYEGELIPKGRWLYGWYYQNQCKNEIEHNIIQPREKGSQGQAGLVIDPATLCQFTGLHDIDGKQIFDGDILDSKTSEYQTNGYRFICKWIDSGFALDFIGLTYGVPERNPWINRYPLCQNNVKDLRIIGNIFDNPELMKDFKAENFR